MTILLVAVNHSPVGSVVICRIDLMAFYVLPTETSTLDTSSTFLACYYLQSTNGQRHVIGICLCARLNICGAPYKLMLSRSTLRKYPTLLNVAVGQMTLSEAFR